MLDFQFATAKSDNLKNPSDTDNYCLVKDNEIWKLFYYFGLPDETKQELEINLDHIPQLKAYLQDKTLETIETEQVKVYLNAHRDSEPDIHILDDRWKLIRRKSQGANGAGIYGGFYAARNNPHNKVFFKQDPQFGKNIIEVLAGKIMHLLAPQEHKKRIAQVEFANVGGFQNPANSGENVYVASKLYNGYNDLFVDAHLAYNFSERYLREEHSNTELVPVPKKRAKFHERDEITREAIEHGLYQALPMLLALSTFVDDPDVHFENFGTFSNYIVNLEKQHVDGIDVALDVPQSIQKKGTNDNITFEFEVESYTFTNKNDEVIQGYKVTTTDTTGGPRSPDRRQILDINEELEEVAALEIVEGNSNFGRMIYTSILDQNGNTVYQYYGDAEEVRIDFGGAFGDERAFHLFRRNFDGKLHLNDFFRYFPSTDGPSNYNLHIPDIIKNDQTFYDALADIGTFAPQLLEASIVEWINEISNKFGVQPIKEFAIIIGAISPFSFTHDKDYLIQTIKTFLTEKSRSRQQHAKGLALNHLININIQEEKGAIQKCKDYQTKFTSPIVDTIIEIQNINKVSKDDAKPRMQEEEVEASNDEIQVGEKKPEEPTEYEQSIANKLVKENALVAEQLKAYKNALLERLSGCIEQEVQNPPNNIELPAIASLQPYQVQNLDETIKVRLAAIKMQELYSEYMLLRDGRDITEGEMNDFINLANSYEENFFEEPQWKEIKVLGCTLVGRMLGTLLGGVIGFGIGHFIPIVGPIIGAIVGSIIGAALMGTLWCYSSEHGTYTESDKTLKPLLNTMREGIRQGFFNHEKKRDFDLSPKPIKIMVYGNDGVEINLSESGINTSNHK